MHGIVKPIWCLQTSPRIRQFHQDAIFFLTAGTENAKKLKKKKKIKNTVHKQKCQNAGGVHVRELFTVAEVWNLSRLKLKYQLGSQPKLGHKRNASKSAQEMSRGPAEQSQLFCGCSFPPEDPAEKEKPWEENESSWREQVPLQCNVLWSALLSKCTPGSDAPRSWGPSQQRQGGNLRQT